MANEIFHGADEAKTLYALVYRVSDKYIYSVTNSAFEAVGTWNDARADACDIAMTASGDAHFADFPIVAPGVYDVLIKVQAGGSPDSDDKETGQGVMSWEGASEVSIYSEQKSWQKNG